ncbi:hematopoietic SH2 domain-containing protein homolog [Takifugu rubripes]|uniref:SH2 domain-containing protein n=1 Tax=Takifugu rubripes TaxID=31033 RepID=A0A3B5JV26_TAKRU|nr:hematopoietic SH2 domain-containing protein [Takifugu rubripes]XP_011613092.1 hematopoietic SH2 domain-containing protein [Takifugu rubripes]|eukprot:XP_011613091.1 PREDICTED: hematopoietic SH2 domain-containing protein homolog [Takifugu rubripes]
MMDLSPAVQAQLRSSFSTGAIPDWFHGIITRKAAEELLAPRPRGCFLIRVSESRAGYTLSYRAEDRCKHFMIDVMEDGCFIIVGEKRRHQFLQDLVDFHRHTPITPSTEVLTLACRKKDDSTHYAELLFPQRHRRNAILPPNSSLLPSTSGPVPPEEVRPALPYRPNIPRNPEVQDPTSSHPDTPVPKPRNRYFADNLQASSFPKLPVQNFVPQAKQNISLPPSPSVPTDLSFTSAYKNLAAKRSAVSNLKILNKIFPTDKFMATENKVVKEEETLKGPDAGLPDEYRPPPPFAPGY